MSALFLTFSWSAPTPFPTPSLTLAVPLTSTFSLNLSSIITFSSKLSLRPLPYYLHPRLGKTGSLSAHIILYNYPSQHSFVLLIDLLISLFDGSFPLSNRELLPGQCGSGGWLSSCEPKSYWFDSWSRHMPEFQTRSLVAGVQEAADRCFTLTLIFFFFSLSITFSLTLKINEKTNKL